PSEDDLLTIIKELGYSGKCDMLSMIRTDQMHHPWRTFAAIINRCISGKTTGLDRVEPKKVRKFKKPASLRLKTIPSSSKEHTQKGKHDKRSAKKTSTTLTTGVVIKDTLDVSVSKKKGPAKADRGK
nr:hypothetical protein [Tanacetum cinerariifolium]